MSGACFQRQSLMSMSQRLRMNVNQPGCTTTPRQLSSLSSISLARMQTHWRWRGRWMNGLKVSTPRHHILGFMTEIALRRREDPFNLPSHQMCRVSEHILQSQLELPTHLLPHSGLLLLFTYCWFLSCLLVEYKAGLIICRCIPTDLLFSDCSRSVWASIAFVFHYGW